MKLTTLRIVVSLNEAGQDLSDANRRTIFLEDEDDWV